MKHRRSAGREGREGREGLELLNAYMVIPKELIDPWVIHYIIVLQ